MLELIKYSLALNQLIMSKLEKKSGETNKMLEISKSWIVYNTTKEYLVMLITSKT